MEDSYWKKWEGNSYKKELVSFISHIKMTEAAARLGLVEKRKVAETGDMLKEGASVGVSGEGRPPLTALSGRTRSPGRSTR